MAKKKSKKNHLLDEAQGNQGVMGALGGNAKTIGATIVGALIGEVVEAAVERLIQKAGNGNGRHADNDDESNASNQNASNESRDSSKEETASQHHTATNPIQSAAFGVQDNLSDVRLSMRDAIDAIRLAVGDVTPSFTDVMDTLKTTPKHSKRSVQQSASHIGNTAKTAVQEAVSTAKSTVAELVPANSDPFSKRDKKKGKKKKKK